MAYETFGEFLRIKRSERKFVLRTVADVLGYSVPHMSDIERGRKNPPELSQLEKLAKLLELSDDEKQTMFELAGKKRESIAPDLPEYIMKNEYVAVALRKARDSGAKEEDWQRFIEELENRKG